MYAIEGGGGIIQTEIGFGCVMYGETERGWKNTAFFNTLSTCIGCANLYVA